MIEASESTVDGGLLDTRVVYAFNKARNISLTLTNEEPILFQIESPFADRMLLPRAKAFRKLKFLETMFRTRFELPEDFVDNDLKVLDIIFRGLVEGRFSTRGSDISISIFGSQVDITRPPFSDPGRFRQVVRKPGELVDLFSRKLDLGRVVLTLERACLADPRVIEQLHKLPNEPLNVRLVVLDHQLTYTFQRYLTQRMKKLVNRQLREFRNELIREEPQDLAALVTEALTPDVSSEEAVQIVFGWLQFNHLPDRFCPQEPELNESARIWRVPIGVFYPSGKGEVVAEVVVDQKTGIIRSHTSSTELRRKGEALARTIFHA